MADNIEITAGSGTPVATDDVSGVHYQKIKLAYGAADSATLVDTTNALPVDLRADNAGGIAITHAALTELAAAINTSRLDINIAASAATVTVANGGTFAVQEDGAALTALQLIDDAIYTDDVPFTAGSNALMAVGFRYDDTAPDGVTEGDVGYARMSSARELYAVIRDAAGNERGLNVDASGAIGVTNADLTTLAGAVTGTEMQVDIVAALPAGTNAIGKLAANSGVDIGDVDVLSVVPGTGATNLGKAVDSAAGSTDTGIAALALRDDTLATLTPIDGDYTNLRVSSKGALHMNLASIGGTDVSAPVELDYDTGAGTENVGMVGLALPASGGAVAGGTTSNPIFVRAPVQTDAIHDGTTALTPKFAVIDAATSGDNTLVASVAGKKIRVLQAFLVSSGTVNARFESGAAGTALTGQMNLVANTGFVLPFSPTGWFETAAATLLNLELSGAVSVDGCLVYVEV